LTGSICRKPQGRAGHLSLSQKAGRGFECQFVFPASGVQQAASDLRRACRTACHHQGGIAVDEKYSLLGQQSPHARAVRG